MVVVHPHFHRRYTGITRHIESLFRADGQSAGLRLFGTGIEPSLPRIGMAELVRAARNGELVFHAHRNIELLFGLALRSFFRRARVVFTRHSSTQPSGWTGLLAKRADLAIALTDEMAAMLPFRTAVVGHGVDTRLFAPPRDRASAWAQLGLGGERGIGVIGRVRPEKGQGDFAAALGPLLPGHPEWRAVVIGQAQPAHRPFVEQISAAMGDALRWVGEQQQILPWYQGLSILVQPSHSEGFSMVLLEAMSTGACVVASALPYAQLAITHGTTGFLYPPGDAKALQHILSDLMAHPQKCRDVGARAADEVRRKFAVEGEAAKLREMYASLLSRRGR
jgi:mannosyltransferase